MPAFTKKLWKEEEDAVLRSVVAEYKERYRPRRDKEIKWTAIALQMRKAGVKNRNNKSCRLRWISKLKGNILDIRVHPITPQEDTFILKAYGLWSRRDAQGKVVETPWSDIARCLPGRGENDIKNRWNIHLKKRAGEIPIFPPRGGWTNEEIQREIGIAKNLLRLFKADAAEYKVIYAPASRSSSPAPPPPAPAQPPPELFAAAAEEIVLAVDVMVFPELESDVLPEVDNDFQPLDDTDLDHFMAAFD